MFIQLDFVQELLNQVVPRKRSLSESYSFGSNNDEPLIDEDGWFGDKTSKALGIFRESFGMGGIKINPDDSSVTYRIGNTRVNFTNNSGVVNYIESGDNTDDTTKTFRKLMKDYEHRSSIAASEAYLHNIIDKETLIGRTYSNSDNIINVQIIPGTTNQTAQDTGLYELYTNIVRPFVINIIQEAERYAGINGRIPPPTQNWYSRGGVEPDEHGPGMSYSYGGKNNIDNFNNLTNGVANCPTEDQAEITRRENDPDLTNYRGNIYEDPNCDIGGGDKKWPGLLDVEWELRNSILAFNPGYWAGIDCSGLIQWLAAVYTAPAVNIMIPTRPTEQSVQMLFTVNLNNKMYYFGTERQRWTKKGDLVRYGNWHVAVVFSERSFRTNGNPLDSTYYYKIIHAYGGQRVNGIGTEYYTFPDIPEAGLNRSLRVFGRKVLVTFQDVATATAFGRIKLWN